MKKFEIPYMPINEETNKKFIDFFSKRKENIECIYTPSYIRDGINTRVEDGNFSHDFDEYLYLLNEVKKHFPIEILIQKNCSKEIIQKYYSLEFKRFTINDDTLAKQLKTKYDDIILTLSITRLLHHEDIFNLDLSCYDYIVLDYRYNRQISLLKELPKKYNYVLLVNSSCNYKDRTLCPLHWFDFKNYKDCKKLLKDSSKIYPLDLIYFDNYVHHYKLQGREYFSFENPDNFLRLEILSYLRNNIDFYDLK